MLLDVNFTGNSTAKTLFAAGTIQVHVTDNHDPGRPIPGAQVIARDGTTTLAQGGTDANGNITLEIDLKVSTGQELFTPKPITVVASKNGFTPITQSQRTVTVIAIATIDVPLALAPQ